MRFFGSKNNGPCFNGEGGGSAPATAPEGGAASATAPEGGVPPATAPEGGAPSAAAQAPSVDPSATAPVEPPPSVALLGKDATPEQRKAFFQQIGCPENASGYDFSPAEGGVNDANTETWARSAFHKAGLTAEQGRELYESWNAFAQEGANSSAAASKAQVQADFEAYKASLGSQADVLLGGADKAIAALGLSPEEVKTVRDSMGIATVASLMVKIGQRMGGETGSFVGGQGSATPLDPASMSPEQAKQSIAQLQADSDFMKIYNDRMHPGNRDAVSRMEKLFAAGYRR